MSSKPKDPLDLDEILANAHWAKFYNNEAEYKKAKQQILTHYISYGEVERLIGEDEEFRALADPKRDERDDRKELRNEWRAELKAALNKRRESK